jgi:putative tricarboxylic transport membrane protein
MNKYRFSPAGVLLGLILGPIAENGLRDLLIISDNSPISFMLTRPISLTILFLIFLALYFSFRPRPWAEEEVSMESSSKQQAE